MEDGLRFLQVSGTAPESGTLVFLTQLQMENSDGAESMQHVFREVGRYPPNSPKPRPLFQALAVISKAALNNSKKDNGAETTEFLKGSLCAAVLELERCCTALASPALLTDEASNEVSMQTCGVYSHLRVLYVSKYTQLKQDLCTHLLPFTHDSSCIAHTWR